MFKELIGLHNNILIVSPPFLQSRWLKDVEEVKDNVSVKSFEVPTGKVAIVTKEFVDYLENYENGIVILPTHCFNTILNSESEKEKVIKLLGKFDIIFSQRSINNGCKEDCHDIVKANKDVIVVDVIEVSSQIRKLRVLNDLETWYSDLKFKTDWENQRVIDNVLSARQYIRRKELPFEEKKCSCGKCNNHHSVILIISNVEDGYVDYDHEVIIPGCCNDCLYKDTIKETLLTELNVSEKNEDNLDSFPELPLKNATYKFNMSIVGVPDSFTGCFDVDVTYDNIRVIED